MENNPNNLELTVETLEELIAEILSDPEVVAELLLPQSQDFEMN